MIERAVETRVGPGDVAPMSFTPTPISTGPDTQATPMSPPMPWPSEFPGFEYWVRVRPSGVTGFEPPKIVPPVMKPASPSVRRIPRPGNSGGAAGVESPALSPTMRPA